MEINYFLTLEKVKCEVEKKNWLNYISWSDAWAEIKKLHPDATYRKVKNWDTYLFRSWTGGSVECEVTVNWITHCADLAVTDFKNQEIKYEAIKSTDIQNTLQRAFAKAIAMHWIGLYVYRGEDFPEEYVDENATNEAPRTRTESKYTGATQKKYFNKKDFEACIRAWYDNEQSIAQYIKDNGYEVGQPMKVVIRHYLDNWEIIEPIFSK